MVERVVLIELNEVPNLVLDAYAAKSPFMADLLAKSDRYETVTPDQIQLDPWIAWPSFHRGVADEQHRLLRLGQDTGQADAQFPPIWRLLRDRGVSVGVYGSLFSSCEEDLSGYAFFVPDVFSPHGRVNPPDLEGFQAFNLAMTRASARNVDSHVGAEGVKAMGEIVLQGRVRPSTLARLASQLVSEKVNSKRITRRRNSQTELHADVFMKLMKDTRPDFATFYTNNVAAAMHRFWSASVLNDGINQNRLKSDWVDTYANEVFEALYSVERLLRRLASDEAGPVTIVLASALGQEEIPSENHQHFLTITRLEQFIQSMLGKDARYAVRPTMVPDFSVRFEDTADAEALHARLSGLEIGGDRAVETLERMRGKELVGAGTPLAHIRHDYSNEHEFKFPVTFSRSDPKTVHISFQIDDYSGPEQASLGNRTYPFGELGLGFVKHDEGVNCTAQHNAGGSLVVRRAAGGAPRKDVEIISSLDATPSLLSHFGAPAASYMRGRPSVSFG